MNQWKTYSHVANFTGYMDVVARYFSGQPKGLNILDLPAGNGLFADALRGMGHNVVCGDINRERPDYHYVDMAAPLPFRDGEFDAVTCLEGLEHLVNPVQLIGELARVTRAGGEIVVSTPNVMSLYSRLHQLLTGVPYQFNPALAPVVEPGAAIDRGHVFPLSYYQLRFLFWLAWCARQNGIRRSLQEKGVNAALCLPAALRVDRVLAADQAWWRCALCAAQSRSFAACVPHAASVQPFTGAGA